MPIALHRTGIAVSSTYADADDNLTSTTFPAANARWRDRRGKIFRQLQIPDILPVFHRVRSIGRRMSTTAGLRLHAHLPCPECHRRNAKHLNKHLAFVMSQSRGFRYCIA